MKWEKKMKLSYQEPGERGDFGNMCPLKCRSLMGLSSMVALSEDKA